MHAQPQAEMPLYQAQTQVAAAEKKAEATEASSLSLPASSMCSGRGHVSYTATLEFLELFFALILIQANPLITQMKTYL